MAAAHHGVARHLLFTHLCYGHSLHILEQPLLLEVGRGMLLLVQLWVAAAHGAVGAIMVP